MTKIKEKVYISGPISGRDMGEVIQHFGNAKRELESLGYDAVSPLDNGLSQDEPWHKQMSACFIQMGGCNVIAFLKGWKDSIGSCCEELASIKLGMRVIYEESNWK